MLLLNFDPGTRLRLGGAERRVYLALFDTVVRAEDSCVAEAQARGWRRLVGVSESPRFLCKKGSHHVTFFRAPCFRLLRGFGGTRSVGRNASSAK